MVLDPRQPLPPAPPETSGRPGSSDKAGLRGKKKKTMSKAN